MSHLLKSMVLLLVMLINYLLVSSITVDRVDWSSFFPHSQEKTINENWFDSSSQYLFIELPQVEIADSWLEDSKILNYYELNAETNLYLLIFDRIQQTELLGEISSFMYSGTSTIGIEIMKNFFEEAIFYALNIVPFMLLILFTLTSLKYWLNMLLEISTYHLFLVLTVFLTGFSIDSASLLALMFLIIYAFTLFNYLHSGEMSRSSLGFGISISVLTTALSSIFLFYSNFGLISSFGAMMLVGLSVLLVYSLLRLYLIQNFHFPFCFTDKQYVTKSTVSKILLFLFASLLLLSVFKDSKLTIDLNPVNLMNSSSNAIKNIDAFEKKHLNSLPFVVEVKSKDSEFTELEEVKKLGKLIDSIQRVVNSDSLNDIKVSYEIFSEDKFDSLTQKSYAQFMLALEMMNSGMPIFSTDYKSSFVTMLIPLKSDSSSISSMVKELENLEKIYPSFDIKVMGKIADLGSFSILFLKEFFVGLLFSIGFVFIFFLFYCKTYRTIVVVISTLFSLATLMAIHALFSIDVTIMTLLSVILFAGLVTDSIVHIFICYKKSGATCFESVTKPIVLSNISMLVGLVGMLFSGSLMQRFGFELAILIAANLLFIIYLMPYLLDIKIFRKCNDQGDSCET